MGRDSRSNVASFPGSTPRVAPMNPAHLDLTPSLFEVLSSPELREAHEGEEWFTLCNLPGYLHTLTNNLRLKVEQHSEAGQPSKSSTLDAAIRRGVDDLHAHEDIRSVLALRREVDGSDEWGIEEIENVQRWFRSLSFDVPNRSLSPSPRINIQLTGITKAALFSLAADIGVSASKLATLAIMQTYAREEDTFPPSRIARLTQEINDWVSRVRLHRDVGEAIVGYMRRVYDSTRQAPGRKRRR